MLVYDNWTSDPVKIGEVTHVMKASTPYPQSSTKSDVMLRLSRSAGSYGAPLHVLLQWTPLTMGAMTPLSPQVTV